MENQTCDLGDENGTAKKFPFGMSVLAVDDDPICLKVLETLLVKCEYQVTTTNQAVKALKILRENRNKFDLVISDVNMPDMDGFKLLELVGLEMDLPVIMLSAHSDTSLVMKGVTHGACDYLLKPVRLEELKNIWQHVLRRKKFDNKDKNRASQLEKANNIAGERDQGISSEKNSDQSLVQRTKDQGEDEEEDGEDDVQENEEDTSTRKRPRVVWSIELHKKFVEAVDQLGLEKAVPKKILELMSVEGLTRENVASHLQKYRIYLKKATQQAKIAAALGGEPYLRMGSLEGYGDFCTLSSSGRLSSTFPSSGIFSRLNSPGGLSMRGISSSGLISLGQSQNSSIATNVGNLQTSSILSANSSLFQNIPTPIDLSQSQPSNCAIGFRQFGSIDDSGGFAGTSGFLDSKVTLGANSSVACVSSNHLILPGSSQQSQNLVGFRNQSSFGAASLNSETLGICGSDFFDYARCNESWQGVIQLSKFPSNSLPLSETFTDDQLPTNILNVSSSNTYISNNPVDFSSAVPLEDLRGELQSQEGLIGNVVQSSHYPMRQSWELHKQDYNQNMNCNFNTVNSLVSTSDGIISTMDQFNGATPSTSQFNEDDRFNSDLRFKSTDAYQDGFIRNIGYLDDIMGAMVKREQHEMLMMDGEIRFDAYPIGSCN